RRLFGEALRAPRVPPPVLRIDKIVGCYHNKQGMADALAAAEATWLVLGRPNWVEYCNRRGGPICGDLKPVDRDYISTGHDLYLFGGEIPAYRALEIQSCGWLVGTYETRRIRDTSPAANSRGVVVRGSIYVPGGFFRYWVVSHTGLFTPEDVESRGAMWFW